MTNAQNSYVTALKSNTMFDCDFVRMVFVGFVCFSLGMWAGNVQGQKDFQDAAVKNQHAEYYLDQNNEKAWRWK